MDIFQIADSLPNGFHDSELTELALNFAKRSAHLSLSVWIGDNTERETYRAATLELRGVDYCLIDPPDPRYPFRSDQPLTIDLTTPEQSTQALQITGVPFRFWVAQWNSFIHMCAADAAFEWAGIPLVRKHERES
jgi:hypothetical protein